jgi:hypothetical protein
MSRREKRQGEPTRESHEEFKEQIRPILKSMENVRNALLELKEEAPAGIGLFDGGIFDFNKELAYGDDDSDTGLVGFISSLKRILDPSRDLDKSSTVQELMSQFKEMLAYHSLGIIYFLRIVEFDSFIRAYCADSDNNDAQSLSDKSDGFSQSVCDAKGALKKIGLEIPPVELGMKQSEYPDNPPLERRPYNPYDIDKDRKAWDLILQKARKDRDRYLGTVCRISKWRPWDSSRPEDKLPTEVHFLSSEHIV